MAPGVTEVEAVIAVDTPKTTPSNGEVKSGTPNTATKIGAERDAVKEPEVGQVGMECDIKNLYQKEDERGRKSWTDQYPDNLDDPAENEITARYAILVRNKKSYDSKKKLEIDSIVVQSPLLKHVLSKVLKDYPGKTSHQLQLNIPEQRFPLLQAFPWRPFQAVGAGGNHGARGTQ